MSLPEINYDAIKREIIPILQHSVSEDQDHTRHNGALARGFLDSKRYPCQTQYWPEINNNNCQPYQYFMTRGSYKMFEFSFFICCTTWYTIFLPFSSIWVRFLIEREVSMFVVWGSKLADCWKVLKCLVQKSNTNSVFPDIMEWALRPRVANSTETSTTTPPLVRWWTRSTYLRWEKDKTREMFDR